MPVNLLSLSVSEKNNVATLEWSTQQEQNNKGFEIEKSYDGVTYFKIGFVPGKGNSSVVTNYSIDDKNLSDIQYYRLRQVDFDLRASVSNTVSLKLPKKAILDLLSVSNPFGGSIAMQFNKPLMQKTTVELFDITGKRVYTAIENPVAQSLLQVNINSTSIGKGVYMLKITTGNQSFLRKVIKS